MLIAIQSAMARPSTTAPVTTAIMIVRVDSKAACVLCTKPFATLSS
ncbi:hypothetical protein AU375_00001 [Methylobacterium radiotolerans]|nr:hypothetical protein AU375_00001 [Methylobacterium radiotolerans]